MSATESLFERPVVADTVVVNYFLAVGAFDLLRSLLGGVVQVPRAVFDPDEPDDVAEDAASELRRGLRRHRMRSADRGIGRELRERSARALPHFERLPELVERGEILVLLQTSSPRRFRHIESRLCCFSPSSTGSLTGLGRMSSMPRWWLRVSGTEVRSTDLGLMAACGLAGRRHQVVGGGISQTGTEAVTSGLPGRVVSRPSLDSS